ncbi:Tyrosine recombinase XerC [subsurface metagenome]
MASINFYLKVKEPDKQGRKPIIAQITFNRKKYRKQIEKIRPKYWNSNKQRITPNRESEPYNRHSEINLILDRIESNARELFNSPLINNEPLTEYTIIQFFNNANGEVPRQLNFKKAIQKFIDSGKATKAKRTIMGYVTVFTFLKDFEKDTGTILDYDNINLDFFQNLEKYAFNKRKTKDNYYAKIVTVLKTFLHWSIKCKLYSSLDFKHYSYQERDKEIIYLTWEELNELYNHNFKTNKLKQVRDLYSFACFTGLRFSDLQQIRHENILGEQLNIIAEKTEKETSIPLTKKALQILDRYKDKPVYALPRISHQKANDYIKDCCKEIELFDKIIITEYRGANKKQIVKEKYKLITMHTARKTFITNSLQLGMNVKTIKNITGHVKDSTFDKYLKITEDYKKNEMLKAWDK